MRTRLISFVLMLVLVASFAAPLAQNKAQAQDGWCTLAPEDCEVLNGAIATAGSVTSLNVDSLTLVLQVSAGEMANVDVDLAGSGPLVAVEGGIAPFETDMTLNATMVSNGEEDTVEGARLIIKDDKAYTFDPEAGTWSVEEATAEDFQDMNLEALSIESIVNGLAAFPAGTIEWSREDMDMNGMSVAVFTADVKLGELMGSEEFLAQLSEALAPLLADQGLDASTLSFALGMVMAQLGDQFDAAVMRYTLHIDPATGNLYGISFDLDMDLDLSSLAAMMGQDASSVPPISVLIDLDIAISGHNETYEITVPEEAMAAEGTTETEGE